MNTVFTYYFYGITGLLLIFSFIKNKTKTFLSLKKALKMFLNVLPQFLAILFLLGLLLAIINPEVIENTIGAKSGVKGMAISAALGSAALIPVIIAFPIAAKLLQNGAGVMQIAVFISTLTTVGFVTMPIEIKYLGKKTAVLRNIFALVFSFATASIMGIILK